MPAEDSMRTLDFATVLACIASAAACAPEAESLPELALRVRAVDLAPSGIDVPPKPDRAFVRIDAELDNRTGDALPLSFAYFEVRSDDDLLVMASPASELLDDACATDTAVAPFTEQGCSLVVEIPEGDLPAQLRYDDGFGHVAEAEITICPDADAPDLCGTACVSLADDPFHCGACDRALVIDGAVCIDGEERCADEDDEICDGACIDVRTSPEHCGECDRAVGDGETCIDGEPTCESPRASCDGQCIDVSSDPENCGDCGRAINPGQTCTGGEIGCGLEAAILCGEWCVDPGIDPDHCGECDRACPGSGECIGGTRCLLVHEDDESAPCSEYCASAGYACVSGFQYHHVTGICTNEDDASPLDCDATPSETICGGEFYRRQCRCVLELE
jgi:hypothetical protein